MECRGIGIINVAELFGIRCVRLEKSIDMIVTFVEWQPGIVEDRTGLDKNYFDVLGVQIPHFIIPVRPGRAAWATTAQRHLTKGLLRT